MADLPTTQYVETADGSYIAYQVVGDGPLDMALMPTSWSNVEFAWDDPFAARFFHGLGSLGRLILFDKRGCGLSDPVALRTTPPPAPTPNDAKPKASPTEKSSDASSVTSPDASTRSSSPTSPN